MPEIAEVRLIADNIESVLKGTWISSIEIQHPERIEKYVKRNVIGLDLFTKQLPLLVTSVNTKGKFCWLELTNNNDAKFYIMVSFGMSGNVRQAPSPEILNQYNLNRSKKSQKPIDTDEYMKHCHIKITYNSIDCLYYHDIRRFGRWVFLDNRQELDKKLNKLGHDVLQNPELSKDEVLQLFKPFGHQNICKALMSQELFAGLGNYLKSETLYASNIYPLGLIKNISPNNLYEMYLALYKMAHDAYKSGGASLYTYTGMGGDQTDFKNTLKIYKRQTDPLGNKIVTIPEQQSPDKRTTFWVPEIQTSGKLEQKPKIILQKIKKIE